MNWITMKKRKSSKENKSLKKKKKPRPPRYSTEELNDLIRIVDDLKETKVTEFWPDVKNQMNELPHSTRTIKSYQYFYNTEKWRRVADIEYSLQPYELEELLEIKRLKETVLVESSRKRNNRNMRGLSWLKISKSLDEKFKIKRNPHNIMSFYLACLKTRSVEEITHWHNSKPNVLNESDLKTIIYI